MEPAKSKWIIALTGASGMRYGLRLLDVMTEAGCEAHVIISEAGLRVLHEEEKIKSAQSGLSSALLIGREEKRISFYHPRDIAALPASGSVRFNGMVVCPCSMGTLANIAAGTSSNLIHRAADVTLKEQRRLILVPRETPLSLVHLENMLRLSKLSNVTMLPAMPGFYHNPNSISELVDMIVMRILDHMDLNIDLIPRWRAGEEEAPQVDKVLEFKHEWRKA